MIPGSAMIKKILPSLFFLLLVSYSQAQFSITNAGIPYFENFNSIANSGTSSTLPVGWFMSTATYTGDNGVGSLGTTYSYGTTSSVERSLGSLASNATQPKFGINFINNSGVTITSITISYTGEQWRMGQAGVIDRLDFQYSLTATDVSTGTWIDENNLDFVPPVTTGAVGAIDGNNSSNRTLKSFTITALNILNGSSFWLRWNDFNPSGADHGNGIDDISVAFNGATAPPCSEPSSQPPAGTLVLTPAPTSISGSFNPATPAADGYLIIRSLSNSLNADPADGTNYSQGQALGGGVVVSSGSLTSFIDNGLTSNTTYYYYIFSFNGENCTAGPNYLVPAPLTNNNITTALTACVAPGVPGSLNLAASNTSVYGNFSAAAGANRYLLIRSLNNTLSASPANGTAYTPGQSFGGGTIVGFNVPTSFSVTGLSPSTTYYFYLYAAAADCNGEPVYNPTQVSAAIATNAGTGAPAAYYTSATGTCQTLKTNLFNIISTNHTALSYTPGTWNAYQYTDIHRNDANSADIIWDVYSDNPTGPEPYEYTFAISQCGGYNSEGDCYNREHSFPQSWFNNAIPMLSDLHQLYPTDGHVNGLRSNFPYGETNSGSTTANGSKLGPSSVAGYSGTVFEPRNEYKGDLARAQLYMAVRYEDMINGWNTNGNANDVLLSPADEPDAAKRKLQVYDTWYLQLLFKWHNQDPVSQKEIDRNNAIYYQPVNDGGIYMIQGNRNPFIDHPEYVYQAFSCTSVLPVTLLDFSGYASAGDVVLTWSVNREVNFSRFELERSTDGTLYSTIGSVASTNAGTYIYRDKKVIGANVLYYRLKMIDVDGKVRYSKVITVRTDGTIDVVIYPNPAHQNIQVKLERSLTELSFVFITDMTGRIVHSEQIPSGTAIKTINTADLPAGKYILQIKNSKQKITKGIIKL